MDNSDSSSWEPVSAWYSKIVGKEGHDHHRIIVPKLIQLLTENTSSRKINSLLDIGCGDGVLTQYLPKQVTYLGIDIAPSLIKKAKARKAINQAKFQVLDATLPLLSLERSFSHAVAMLSLQNMQNVHNVFINTSKHLESNGLFVVIINHPVFRIPKNSHWCNDPKKNLFFRRIDQYLTPLKIPIQVKPSQGKESIVTWSYHYPISQYFTWIKEAGLYVIDFQEWTNEIKQAPKGDKMRKASKEIPLFAAIICRKNK